MNKHWMIAAAACLFTGAAFAQQGSVTYGEIAVVRGADGTVVMGEEVTASKEAKAAKKAAEAKKASAKAQMKAKQASAGAKATEAANKASLKKGEPALKVNTTTTTTNVYDVSMKDKKGTADYGIIEESYTNAQGQTTTDGVAYSNYTPSRAARANEKRAEVSFAVGQTYSFNKDSDKDRYATNGIAAGASVLWDMAPHFGMGFDYMFLNPDGKSHHGRDYHKFRAHNIALGGKYTLNVWDNLRVYMPMGAGLMNARLKTSDAASSTSKDKWGASLYTGLGLQYDLSANMFAGLEYRYTYAFISDKHLSDFGRDKDLQFHTVFFRLGTRF